MTGMTRQIEGVYCQNSVKRFQKAFSKGTRKSSYLNYFKSFMTQQKLLEGSFSNTVHFKIWLIFKYGLFSGQESVISVKQLISKRSGFSGKG